MGIVGLGLPACFVLSVCVQFRRVVLLDAVLVAAAPVGLVWVLSETNIRLAKSA